MTIEFGRTYFAIKSQSLSREITTDSLSFWKSNRPKTRSPSSLSLLLERIKSHLMCLYSWPDLNDLIRLFKLTPVDQRERERERESRHSWLLSERSQLGLSRKTSSAVTLHFGLSSQWLKVFQPINDHKRWKKVKKNSIACLFYFIHWTSLPTQWLSPFYSYQMRFRSAWDVRFFQGNKTRNQFKSERQSLRSLQQRLYICFQLTFCVSNFR
jgi:hypothetical protein